MDGLEEFFSSKITEEETKVRDKTRYIPYIRIRNFSDNVGGFLKLNYNYTDNLEYLGSYTEMMRSLFNDGTYEKITFRIPDYPDYELVQNQINEIFTHYI